MRKKSNLIHCFLLLISIQLYFCGVESKVPHRIAADFWRESLRKQETSLRHFDTTNPGTNSATSTKTAQKSSSLSFLPYCVKVGLAGGIAGATGTACLYPVDSAKTLRQSNPSKYSSVWNAFQDLIYDHVHNRFRVARLYAGVIPATLGAIPSSALYFGMYETTKALIQGSGRVDRTRVQDRLVVHSLAAASGNVLSSMFFVPKEVIKQQMQYYGETSVSKVCRKLIQQHGVRSLYSGYRATLLRNIPSAMLRFVLYEELKWAWYSKSDAARDGKVLPAFSWRVFMAGAVAGALASGVMTPVDVLKTRLSTGMCPVDGVQACAQLIIREDGVAGLYAGAGSRMLWSGAFSALGFCSLETAKGWLGISEEVRPPLDGSMSCSRRSIALHHVLYDVFRKAE